MDKIFKIEAAIKKLCEEISEQDYSLAWHNINEQDLLSELISCILGSRVSYEMAIAAAEKIKEAGLFDMSYYDYPINSYEYIIYNILKGPLHQPGWAKTRFYRFPKTRANYIARTVKLIYKKGGSLKSYLKSFGTAFEARQKLISLSVGLGPKQSSLFLRNIGFTNELAIIDSHILSFLYLSGVIETNRLIIGSIKNYEIVESTLQNYAKCLGFTLGCLDLAIWIVMRVYLKEMAHEHRHIGFGGNRFISDGNTGKKRRDYSISLIHRLRSTFT
jgi:N-glycosylase/DNA lyase